MKNCYALFIKTGREVFVEKNICRFFADEAVLPFVPTVERVVKLPRVVKTECKRMFPGYLFVESEIGSVEFYVNIRKAKFFIQEIMSVVRYGREPDIAMHQIEKDTLMALLDGERCLVASKGYIENDTIYITDGALKGMEGIIRKIDRHKRTADIELEMFGRVVRVPVALEIVSKD